MTDTASKPGEARLYIPPQTRLETVWRSLDHDGRVVWSVYTACPDRNAPYKQMLGTALHLLPDGSAERHTTNPDGMEQIMLVMPHVQKET